MTQARLFPNMGGDMSGKCSSCGVELTQKNTTPSRWRDGIRACAECERKRVREWLKNNPEWLSFQHANGNGKKHRASISSNPGLYGRLKDLKDRGYPVRFELPDGTPIHIRILCHNCHYSIDHYGYCPHKEDKSDFDIPIGKKKAWLEE